MILHYPTERGNAGLNLANSNVCGYLFVGRGTLTPLGPAVVDVFDVELVSGLVLRFMGTDASRIWEAAERGDASYSTNIMAVNGTGMAIPTSLPPVVLGGNRVL